MGILNNIKEKKALLFAEMCVDSLEEFRYFISVEIISIYELKIEDGETETVTDKVIDLL